MPEQNATTQPGKRTKPLDVLVVAGRFEVRGSSTQTLNIAESFRPVSQSNGEDTPPPAVRARVLCVNASRLSRTARQSVRIEEIGPLAWPVIGSLARRYLLAGVIESPPELIHIQGTTMHGLGRWLARRARRPYVVTLHRQITPRDGFRLDRTWGRTVITMSDAVKRSVLENSRTPEDRVRVVRNGVKTPTHARSVPILDRGHRPTIGTAGPLEQGQGLAYFLKAIPQILAAGPAPLATDDASRDLQFLIAGAGPEERALRGLARDLGVSARTTFVSNLYDFSESLAAMDVFCLPTERTGMGVTLLEAMSTGVPVIATDVANAAQVIEDGVTGCIIPPTDSNAIARAVTQLLRDPVRARSIGEQAHNKVANEFPLQNMLDDLLEVYRAATVEAVSS